MGMTTYLIILFIPPLKGYLFIHSSIKIFSQYKVFISHKTFFFVKGLGQLALERLKHRKTSHFGVYRKYILADTRLSSKIRQQVLLPINPPTTSTNLMFGFILLDGSRFVTTETTSVMHAKCSLAI